MIWLLSSSGRERWREAQREECEDSHLLLTCCALTELITFQGQHKCPSVRKKMRYHSNSHKSVSECSVAIVLFSRCKHFEMDCLEKGSNYFSVK